MNSFAQSLIIFAVIAAFSMPASAGAQITGAVSPFVIEIIPTYPRPGDSVTIRVNSFTIDLDQAQIAWSIDGRTTAQGAAVKEVSFTAGPLGSRTIIGISALVEGLLFSDQVVIQPVDINLIWQADTYVHPFYSGKALAGSEANFTIVALPRVVNTFGSLVSADDLVFTWKENGRVLGSQSGRGKNILRIVGPRIFNTTQIEVAASTVAESVTAKRILTLRSVSPAIIFYENSPLLGMRFEKALPSPFELKREEITVTAHPFFFSSSERVSSDFQYKWVINGSSIEAPPGDNSSLVLRQTGSGAGFATISLTIQNLKEVLQRARSSFSVNFGAESGDGFSF